MNQYSKLMGCQLDTNQFTSQPISSLDEAESAVKRIVGIYGEDILDYMHLSDDGVTWTTYSSKLGLSLREVLTN